MHVVITMMVMCVTFFAVIMIVVVLIIIIVSPFHEQRFHVFELRNRYLFSGGNVADGLFHERFHLRPNPDN